MPQFRIHKLLEDPVVVPQETEEGFFDVFILECYGENPQYPGEFDQFTLWTDKPMAVYKIQKHMKSPTLEPFVVEMDEFDA
jgi:hypothetical protein